MARKPCFGVFERREDARDARGGLVDDQRSEVVAAAVEHGLGDLVAGRRRPAGDDLPVRCEVGHRTALDLPPLVGGRRVLAAERFEVAAVVDALPADGRGAPVDAGAHRAGAEQQAVVGRLGNEHLAVAGPAADEQGGCAALEGGDHPQGDHVGVEVEGAHRVGRAVPVVGVTPWADAHLDLVGDDEVDDHAAAPADPGGRGGLPRALAVLVHRGGICGGLDLGVALSRFGVALHPTDDLGRETRVAEVLGGALGDHLVVVGGERFECFERLELSVDAVDLALVEAGRQLLVEVDALGRRRGVGEDLAGLLVGAATHPDGVGDEVEEPAVAPGQVARGDLGFELAAELHGFERGEALPLAVLDGLEEERLRVVGLSDRRGDRHRAELLAGGEAPAAGDQLEALIEGTDDDRLEESLLADRLGEGVDVAEVLPGAVGDQDVGEGELSDHRTFRRARRERWAERSERRSPNSRRNQWAARSQAMITSGSARRIQPRARGAMPVIGPSRGCGRWGPCPGAWLRRPASGRSGGRWPCAPSPQW